MQLADACSLSLEPNTSKNTSGAPFENHSCTLDMPNFAQLHAKIPKPLAF